MCQLLLEHGADRDCRDGDGQSAIELARAIGFDVLGSLLSVQVREEVPEIPGPVEEWDAGLLDEWLPED